MYVLDSDIAIWILRNDEEVVRALDKCVGKDSTAISTITIAEVYKNIFPSEIQKAEDFIEHNVIFEVSVEIAKEAGLYWQDYHGKIEKLSLSDCLIVATAKVYQAVFLTLNTRHFPMTDIKVLNPLKLK